MYRTSATGTRLGFSLAVIYFVLDKFVASELALVFFGGKKIPFVVVSVVFNEKVDLFITMLVVTAHSSVIYRRPLLIRSVPSRACPTVIYLTTILLWQTSV